MPSPYDVYIKSAKYTSLETPSEEEGDVRMCSLRLGSTLIQVYSTHPRLFEQLPVLAELAAQRDSSDVISLSPLLEDQDCLTPAGVGLVINFLNGREAYVEPKMVADLLAAANALEVDDIIEQVERELLRLVVYDESILFALENAAINIEEGSPARAHIIKYAAMNLEKVSSHPKFKVILRPTFEILMKEAAIEASAAVFMSAFLTWVKDNRLDQMRACALLRLWKFDELTVVEREEFAKRSASLYLHDVSSAMSKLTGSTPYFEKRVLTHRWSTSSDLSVSSSVDVQVIHEEPFTNTNITIDCSQLSESGRIYSDIEDSLLEIEEGEDGIEKCFDDIVEEECSRLGAGADRSWTTSSSASTTSSSSLSTASSAAPLETKMIDFGTIPIPDGDFKQIWLSVELDDIEQAREYIRKMRFHFDMDVDQKN